MEAKQSSLLNAKLSRRTFVKASAATAVVVGTATTNPWGPAMAALAEGEKSDTKILVNYLIPGGYK